MNTFLQGFWIWHTQYWDSVKVKWYCNLICKLSEIIRLIQYLQMISPPDHFLMLRNVYSFGIKVWLTPLMMKKVISFIIRTSYGHHILTHCIDLAWNQCTFLLFHRFLLRKNTCTYTYIIHVCLDHPGSIHAAACALALSPGKSIYIFQIDPIILIQFFRMHIQYRAGEWPIRCYIIFYHRINLLSTYVLLRKKKKNGQRRN